MQIAVGNFDGHIESVVGTAIINEHNLIIDRQRLNLGQDAAVEILLCKALSYIKS